ncbi:glycosyl transferase group 1 [Prosthecochloris aestuarii DSM 271]|uniref:Glycosyl transferase group 1 n=1 Tax=Prosthecochloris aestuarii (strain DSM 271 / SK 413) TaxID=290512 RepID=B4S4G0_PROA2|nr:glycosyltransferase family 4 protein [Prosthecochloris aestuarii]ACF45408.1 glycosyl transferase group 1 [Prosthecochloris aestuarii DSM 271]
MKLTLFFSKNISLKKWQETGLLNREIALYRKHAENGIEPHCITYDTVIDEEIKQKISFISAHWNRLKLSKYLYYTLIPFLHWNHLKDTDIIKTNQISGSLPAIRAARIFRKPLIARCGYMLSEFAENKYGRRARRTGRALALEKKLFTSADAIIVTTEEMRKYITERIKGVEEKISVLPNYVDTELFKPEEAAKEFDLIFIGRFSEQKNLKSLLEAIERTGCSSLIIGTGPDAEKLKKQHPSTKITWKDNLPNSELSYWLNRSRIFILPSHYEGHPKTLIEAMACGCPVIGADSPGINSVIQHGVNGMLSPREPAALASSIRQLLTNEELRTNLSTQSRSFALTHYSLDTLAEKEYRVIENTVKRFRNRRAVKQ